MRRILTLFALLIINLNCFTQTSESTPKKKKKSKFHSGIYLGSYFAHKYTAAFYDGYGYDADGNKNSFINSFLRQRIIFDYGGGNGLTDQVAQALNVNPREWTFDQSDMPLSMKYSPAFMVGLQTDFSITKKDEFLLNVNVSRLTAAGNFTIVINTPQIGPQPPDYKNIQSFAIIGREQRMLFQMGYRRILGEDELFNCFIEAGALLNLTKYLKNYATINNLYIDLSYYYSQPYYPIYRAGYLSGAGIGAFASFGVNLKANIHWKLQLLYTSSFEKIDIGENPKHTLHHAIGMRALYNL